MTKYSVAVHKPTASQSEKISAAFRDRGFGWWHWIDGFWLVSDSSGVFTASAIRDLVKPICPDSNILVLAVVEGQGWSGTGKRKGDKNMFSWLHKNLAPKKDI